VAHLRRVEEGRQRESQRGRRTAGPNQSTEQGWLSASLHQYCVANAHLAACIALGLAKAATAATAATTTIAVATSVAAATVTTTTAAAAETALTAAGPGTLYLQRRKECHEK
jgi:hypothetical protein